MIKVLTGIRRCGKSCLLRQVAELWKERNPKGEVVFVDMELPECAKYRQVGVLVA